jgi:hypothetical protein
MRKVLLLLIALCACGVVAVVAPAQTIPQVTAAERVTPAPVAPDTAAVERIAPEPRGRPLGVAVSTPVPTEAPVVASEAPPPPVVVRQAVPAVAPAPQPCAATYFCYPRLGIAGPIVAYNDCSGATDVGQGIRQLTCVRAGVWLAGHAYTQFGRITGFRVGDVVFVRGQQFEIFASSVQRSCEPTTQAVAPLSLQTSLEASTCGRVLVVQGR